MVIFSYFLRMFLCLLLKSCYLLKKKKFLRKWKNYTMNGLFFNNFWMIGIEGYFELYINGYMNIMTGSTESLGEVLGFGFAIFYLALIFLIMILIFWISIFKSFDKLNSKKFKSMFEELYGNYKYKTVNHKLYMAHKVSRYFIYLSIALYLQ